MALGFATGFVSALLACEGLFYVRDAAIQRSARHSTGKVLAGQQGAGVKQPICVMGK